MDTNVKWHLYERVHKTFSFLSCNFFCELYNFPPVLVEVDGFKVEHILQPFYTPSLP